MVDMPLASDVETTVKVIASTVEATRGAVEEIEANDAPLLEWLQARRLHPAEMGAYMSLKQELAFDTLGDGRGAIWWPRLDTGDGEIPLICGLTLGGSGFGIRAALVRWSGDRPEALGIRFEEPHDRDGAHSFCHAQLFSRVLKGDEASRLAQSDAWTPDTQPSFPIQASNVLELLWAAAVTLYGKRQAHVPFISNDGARRGLHAYVESLT